MKGRVALTGSGLVVAALLAAGPAPALAQQTDYEAIVRIMRECAKIADMAARVACYDNTVSAERLIAGDAPARPQRADAAPPEANRPAAA